MIVTVGRTFNYVITSDMDPITTIFSGLVGVVITNIVTIFVLKKREQKKREIELLEKFLVSDAMLKSRLVAQEYLVPGINRTKFKIFHNKSFDQINEALENTDEEANRIHIRAIPSFFWLLDHAKQSGVIAGDRQLWSRIYSYYWVMIISPRKGDSNDPLYSRFDWMLMDSDIKDREKEYTTRLEACAIKP